MASCTVPHKTYMKGTYGIRTGAVAWHPRLIGLGSVGHSKYSNRVKIRLHGARLAVYGNESAGRYTEIFDTANGSRLHHEAVHG
jgi:hypothetical protein